MDGDFRLGEWLVAPNLNSLSCGARTVRLEPKAMQVLVCLADGARAGAVVPKEMLIGTVWADTFVTDDVLVRCISELRKAFADDPKNPRYIQTISKGGYRLIAPVVRADSNLEPSATSIVPARRRPIMRTVALLAIAAAAVLLVAYGIASKRFLLGSRPIAPRGIPAVTGPATGISSVAILPFKSERVVGKDDFGVEVADALTTRLSETTRLVVTPTASVLQYSDSNPDPVAVGQALKVDYVLTGKIDRSRHNVTVQVVRIRDGAALLSTTLSQKFSDIFDLEDSLCPRILHDLMVTLDHEDTQRMRKRYTENPQAYEAFLKAHYFMNKPGKEDKFTSIHYFQKAVALDPNYAMAYAGLSDVYMRLQGFGVAPAEFVPKSRAAVVKAIELDDTVAYAHSMLGRIAFFYDWDFDRAAHEYHRARELYPGLVHQWYASYLLVENKPTEAEEENRKFSEFLPFAPGPYFPQFYFWVRRYDRAAAMLNKMLEADPRSGPAHRFLGEVYEQQGRTTDAMAEMQKAQAISGDDQVLASIGHLDAVSGKRADALETLKKLEQLSRRQYVSPFSKALIYAGLEEKNAAINQLQKAFEDRSLSPPALLYDPRLDVLRNEPRFRDFVRKTGVPQ